MLIDEIKEYSKTNKVIMFFDMDGVIAEYKSGEKQAILDNKKDLFFTKRPINSVINTMKELSNNDNVIISILSNCYYKEQKEDKIKWLSKYAPFIKKENIHIITLKDEVYDKESKDYLKAKYIDKLTKNKGYVIYQIEDDHGIIRATSKMLKHVHAEHVSVLIN